MKFGSKKEHHLGCGNGKECKFYHPKQCFKSIRGMECHKQDCTYLHIQRSQSSNEEKAQSQKSHSVETNNLKKDFLELQEMIMKKFSEMEERLEMKFESQQSSVNQVKKVTNQWMNQGSRPNSFQMNSGYHRCAC